MATYKVKTGDNWTNIASKYGVDLQTLIRANSGVSQPHAGVYVNIPGGSSQAAGTRPPISRVRYRRPGTTPLQDQISTTSSGPVAGQAGVIGNPYAQQWLNQQTTTNPFAGAVGSVGSVPTQPTIQPLPMTNWINQQQYQSPQYAQQMQTLLSQTPTAQNVPTQQALAYIPQSSLAQIPGQQPPSTGASWGPGQVSVTTPIGSANQYANSPQYYYGGYNPVTQSVNYINNAAPIFQEITAQVEALLNSGVIPEFISPQVQYNLGLSDNDLLQAGWVQTPYGQWTPTDQVIGEAPGGGDIGGGIGPNPYTQQEAYRGRTGYAGQALRSRGASGYQRNYESGIGAISWRI